MKNSNKPTIKGTDGIERTLSPEIFILRSRKLEPVQGEPYQFGIQVRLISGVNDSIVPGYHYREGWVTVCRTNARVAEFVGFKSKELEQS